MPNKYKRITEHGFNKNTGLSSVKEKLKNLFTSKEEKPSLKKKLKMKIKRTK